MLFTDGDLFEGNWEKDQMSGYGLYVNKSGDRYQGNFLDGKRCGYGIIEFINGDVYRGQWQEDLIWGNEGEFKFSNGIKYSGQFVKGFFEGEGTLDMNQL